MLFRIIILLAIINLFFCKEIFSQETVATFPQTFIGHWKGNLEWFRTGKRTQTFKMQLRILPADSVGQFTWQIIYGEKETDHRPYLLKPVDTAKGHWVIDEKNGIILDSYLHGNVLHGAFTVQGNTIVDNYELLSANEMRVQFFLINLSAKNSSGKGTKDVPAVDSYLISSYQQGILKRIK